MSRMLSLFLILSFSINAYATSSSYLTNTQEKKLDELLTLLSTLQKPLPITHRAKKPFIVVIDAGHGGKDSGAVGLYGTKEKTIVLAIAKALSQKINQTKNMQAVMTRTRDVFVPLRTRLLLARKYHADIFVAIHADAHFNFYAHGASVYALSKHGATSEAARWLARKDNYSELGGVELDTLKDRSLLLRSVLIDLEQDVTIKQSLKLARNVLANLRTVTRLHYSHIEQAPFVVLKSPDIPSILIETGFISNSEEEYRLTSPDYQRKIALAIYEGIKKY